jgi:hypothetical protein
MSPGLEGDGAIPRLDAERSLEHKKEIVRVVMPMPVEWPIKLGHHNVVAVVSRNGAGRKTLGERVAQSRLMVYLGAID